MSPILTYFYLPQELWPPDIPDRATVNWPGFGLGVYAWTVQTYLRVKAAGLPCLLVKNLPTEGLVFLHRNAFRFHPNGILTSSRRLLVCFQGDLSPHPDAQVHIVQNPVQAAPASRRYFMPHWPQPGLQGRDRSRGDRFATVAFFGHQANLAPEFFHADWQDMLQTLGLQWQPIVNQNRWHEYTTLDTRWNSYDAVDVVVAVRSFDATTLHQTEYYRHKPATKLYNAWLAGVPAILGPETAYRAERQHGLDYIEARTLSEVIQALKQLQAQPALRQAMVRQGHQRSRAVTPEALTERWLHLIQHHLYDVYEHWCSHPLWKQYWLAHQSRWLHRAQRSLQQCYRWSYRWHQG